MSIIMPTINSGSAMDFLRAYAHLALGLRALEPAMQRLAPVRELSHEQNPMVGAGWG